MINHPLLARADSLMLQYPDSALTVLRGIRIDELSTVDCLAKYALLLTQAEDKNYILHSDDSLIHSAVKYYDSIGDLSLRAKSHYYWGRVFQDKKDHLAAAREFIIAVPLAKRLDDADLMSLLYSNLGYEYYLRGLYLKADSLYALAEKLAIQMGYSSRLAVALAKRGDINLSIGTNESRAKAQRYLEEALIIAAKTDNKWIESSVLNSLSILYEAIGETSKAMSLAQRGATLLADKQYALSGFHLLKGSLFYSEHNYDSARYYLNQSLSTDNYYTKAGAYMYLSYIAENQKLLDEAIYFKNCYIVCADSIQQRRCVDDVVILEKNNQIQYYAHLLQKYLHRYKISLFVLFIGIIALTILYVAIYRKSRNSADVNINKEKIRLIKLKDSLNLLHADLQNKELEITELQKLLSETEEDKGRIYSLSVQIANLRTQRNSSFIRLMNNSKSYSILLMFIQQKKTTFYAKDEFKDNDWKSLIADINYYSNGFTERLESKYILLNKNDIRFCCLCKIRLSYSDMAIVMGRTLDAMYKKKSSILHKMNLHSSQYLLGDILDNI